MTIKMKEVGVFVRVWGGRGGKFVDKMIRSDHYKSERIGTYC